MRQVPLLAGWTAVALGLAAPSLAAGQAWNSDASLALVQRAIARRGHAAGDSTLKDYTAQAHGFLFFLGQFGAGLTDPPRLIRADQLELEVYWKAPGLSKQRIVGWRDQADIPTDIVYHRDHLGIIQNNFGSAIRLGDGDEVRDVPHPLATGGPDTYDYALGDSTSIALPTRTVRVVAVLVRPKDFSQPAIVGKLYVDVETADLVRMAFNFTRRSYLDPELEDVSVVLDDALWDNRFWLPYRQDVEIRRRATWLDVPARGIIRGHWEVDGYRVNVGLAASWFGGEEITAIPKAERDSFPWREPLATAIEGVAAPVRESDMAAVRAGAERIAVQHALSGLKARRVAAGGISDLVHVNRVEGLAVGAGGVVRGGPRGRELRVQGGYGFADRRVTGRVAGELPVGRTTLEGAAYRSVRDVADVPVVSPLLNSLAAQEFGADDGDYYLATGARVGLRRGMGARGAWSIGAARETIGSLSVRLQPAAGTFRPNPPLGGTSLDVAQLTLERRAAGFGARGDVHGTATLEVGRLDGGATYGRVAAIGDALFPIGKTQGLIELQTGAASGGVPPHRAFVLGGRGTLLGEEFRVWGGRRMALLQAEWRVRAPFPSLAVGSYTRTPHTAIVAPFVAMGWADRPIAGTPWLATPGARTTVGVALEWLGLVRLEAGIGAQTGRVGVTIDVLRDFWGIL